MHRVRGPGITCHTYKKARGSRERLGFLLCGTVLKFSRFRTLPFDKLKRFIYCRCCYKIMSFKYLYFNFTSIYKCKYTSFFRYATFFRNFTINTGHKRSKPPYPQSLMRNIKSFYRQGNYFYIFFCQNIKTSYLFSWRKEDTWPRVYSKKTSSFLFPLLYLFS